MLSFSTHEPDRQVLAARTRVVVVLAMMCAGLTVARAGMGVPSGAAFGIAGLLCAAGAIAPWKWARLVLALGVLTAAAGWGQLRWHERRTDDVSMLAAGDDRAVVTLEGMVTAAPRREVTGGDELARFSRPEPAWRFIARIDRAMAGSDWIGASGGVWVRVGGEDAPAVRAGDRVRLTGIYSRLRGPANPGEEDARLFGAQEGMSGHLLLSGVALISGAEPARGFAAVRAVLVRAREGMRERAREVLRLSAGDDGTGDRAALLGGLLLGEYDPSRRELRESFARTGLAHVLSISGFHIVVLTVFLSSLVRLFGERGVLQHGVVAAALVAYLALVAPSAPVVLVLTIVEWSGRKYDRVTVLGWICAALLVWRPLDLWSLGFQLSAGLTALLLWAGERFHQMLFPPPLRGLAARPVTLVDVVARSVKGTVSASLLCAACSAPLVMMRVGVVTPLAVFATIVVSPLIVVLLFCAYAALLAGLCVPALAGLASGALGLLASMVVGSVRFFESLPFAALPSPPVGAAWTVFATATLLWLMLTHRRGALKCAAVGVMVGWCALSGLGSARLRPGVAVRIDCLDVGNGTCMLVRSGDRAVLWDCGTLARGDGGAAIVRACRALGVWRVPIAVVTHPDVDHFGMLPRVARDLGVERVVTCERFLEQARAEEHSATAECARILAARGVELGALAREDRLSVGAATLEICSPDAGAAFAGDNDHSLVALLTHPALSRPAALLCGDVQDAAIDALALPGVHPLVMEAPHHGSARASAVAWVRSLDPAVVLQSSGSAREGDPRWESTRKSREWLSTASGGACWVEVMSDGTLRCGRSLAE